MEQQTIFEISENQEQEQSFTSPTVTPSLIESKWEIIRIGAIKEVEITNKQYYEEEEIKEAVKPSNFNSFIRAEKRSKIEKNGLLKSSDLKISFTISKKAPMISPSLLSFRKVDQTLLTNHRSKIEIIHNNQTNYQSETTSNQDEIYTIEVPFYSGLENLKVPFFDDFHSKGKNLIHHTIVFDAYDENNLNVRSNENGEVSLRSIPEISYFIRLVIKDYKEVEIVSISSNNVDMNRVTEIFHNSKEMTILSAISLKNSIVDLFGKCKRSKKAEKNNKENPPSYSQIEYHLVDSNNVNNHTENRVNKVEERSDLYAQFHKFDNIQNYATPMNIPFPPNCQIVYCISQYPMPIPQNNN